MADRQVRKIILVRKNHIRQYFSKITLEKFAFSRPRPLWGLLKRRMHGVRTSVMLGRLRSTWRELHAIAKIVRYHPGWTNRYWPRGLEIDVSELLTFINHKQRFFEYVEKTLNDSEQEYLRVFYEDLGFDCRIAECERIQRFLEVPISPLQSTTVKLHGRPLNELISNYKQLEVQLEGSVHQSLLYS